MYYHLLEQHENVYTVYNIGSYNIIDTTLYKLLIH